MRRMKLPTGRLAELFHHWRSHRSERFDFELIARKELISGAGFVRGWDDSAKAPYLWNATSNTFISYDDPQ